MTCEERDDMRRDLRDLRGNTKNLRRDLRDLRDNTKNLDDKQTLRKCISHVYTLERKLDAIRVFAKAIDGAAKITRGEE